MREATRLAEELTARARKRNLQLAVAESCTAGALANLLSRAPGAGDAFFGGFVCYAKAYKAAILGVPAAVIDAHTAVSEPVATAMARGALDLTGCALALAITGVTGPEPDEDGNPVGLVHIAVATRDGTLRHRACDFAGGGREDICNAAIEHALRLACEVLPD